MDKINFENLPSTNTPISAENLNQLQTNVETALETKANAETVEEELETKANIGTVLYENETGTTETVTLSESATNFSYLEIFYKNIDAVYSETKISQPDGKTVNLTCPVVGGSQVYISNAMVLINGTNISFLNNRRAHAWDGIENGDYIYITKVVGYKNSRK